MTETVREVLIAAIDVVTNPRKRFDDAKLQSLADSIARDGLVQPILVRPSENGKPRFELVSGERRLRAHLLLGRDMIRSTIREMDERQAARIRLVENLHREDLHELDEALAFQQLLEDEAYTVPMLAAECGRSESYVYQRLKLLELTDAARDAFHSGEIPAAHALAIARLRPEDQKTALEYATTERFTGAPSTAQLQTYIGREILLQLGDGRAPFDPKDAELVPAAGACTTCPKRTGNTPGLWPELEGDDRCTDRSCFEQKRDAAVAEAVAGGVVPVCGWHDKPPKAHPDALTSGQCTRLYHEKCAEREEGILVTGHEAGTRIWICRSGDCPRHGRSSGKLTKAEKQRRKQEKERQQRLAAVTSIVREKILQRVDLGDVGQLRCLVRLAEERLYHDHRIALCRELGFEGKPREYGGGRDYSEELEQWILGQSADELRRTLVRILITTASAYSWRDLTGSDLAKVATAFGYQIHNAARTVLAASEVVLPEDRA